MDIVRQVLGTKKGSKKRFWSDDEKRSICLQARVPGVSVARRYAMNAPLIHNWLRDERFAHEDSDCVLDGAAFLPVEIEGPQPISGHQITALAPDMPLSAQRVDITLSDGRRILVEGTTALSAVLALIEGLMP